MIRLVPPAGVPIRAIDIIKMTFARLRPQESIDVFKDLIKEISGMKYCAFVNSGRAANYIILKTLKEISGGSKNEIVIPAYTCFSVPASIIRAGLKIRLVDIVPETMDYDYGMLAKSDTSNTLAILPCNLFGIVSDWAKLREIVRNKAIFLVDDSAQTMGISFDGQKSGSFGDIGFFSMGRGKNMTIYSGGVILTNNPDIAERIENELRKISTPNIFSEIRILSQLLIYAIMLHPRLYWIPGNISFLGLGKTLFDENFRVSKLSRLQICAGPVMFPKLQRLNSIRSSNANAIIPHILKTGRFIVPGWSEGSNVPYIRLPVLAPDRETRDKIIQKLRSKGIVSSEMYPSTIRHVRGISNMLAVSDDNYKGADFIINSLFTLPTHEYLSNGDVKKIINCFS